MSNKYGPRIVTDGLVLCLDAADRNSYPGSGTSWYDLSGNGNNGTLVNGPTFNSDAKGNILIDGTNDYVSIAATSDFAFGTGDFTFEMFVKDYNTTNNYQHFFAINNQSYFGWKGYDNGSRVQIYFYSTAFRTDGTGGIANVNANEWILDYEEWTHIALVRSSGVAYGYKNGELKGSKSGWTSNYNVSTYLMYLGFGWTGEYRQEGISNAKIYNKALSSVEIQQNYNATKGRFGL